MNDCDGRLRILVVEDEILIALELESLLAEEGHEVVGIAPTSAEAIRMGEEMRPDLAFVDVHLADGPTGVEAARRLAATGETTVLFMTANAKRIPEDCAGAHGVISKPYTERGVRQAIDFVRRRLTQAGESDAGASKAAPRLALAPTHPA